MTTIYRIRSGRTVEPFGDEVPKLTVADKTVAQWQEEAAAGAGLKLVDVEAAEDATERPCFAFFDDVFVTEMAMRHFVADCKDQEVRVAVADTPAAQSVEPLQNATKLAAGARGYDLLQLVDKKPLVRDDIDERFAPLVLAAREATKDFELPPANVGGDGKGRVAAQLTLTARIVANVRHWIHVLRLSHLAIGTRLVDSLRAEPRKLLAVRWAHRSSSWAAARKMVFVHPTAQVHPTADLEASVVGPGAVVEAHAHVRHSIIGPKVQVQDHAKVVGCTFAEGVQVLRNSYFAGCAAFPRATLSNVKTQLCLFGEASFLTSSVLMIDARLEGEVRVQDGDRFVPVGPFLGSCLGHRVTLGTGVTVEAGRSIANDLTVVVRAPGYLADTHAPEGATLVTVKDGKLEPM